MENLEQYVKDFKIKHPLFAIEAEDLLQLCKDEIDEGGSRENEISLCYSALDDLLTDG